MDALRRLAGASQMSVVPHIFSRPLTIVFLLGVLEPLDKIPGLSAHFSTDRVISRCYAATSFAKFAEIAPRV